MFIEAGFGSAQTGLVRVLEMGFGSGLNAWLTLLEAEKAGRAVEYVGVEKFPVAAEVAAALGYGSAMLGGGSDPRFAALHAAPWDEWTQISSTFRLLKRRGDLTERVPDGAFDVVYWDAFSPETQPELWTPELFGRVYEAMAPGGVLVTYSAKGDVRRALQAAGFDVEKLPGALGKRHMLRAKK